MGWTLGFGETGAGALSGVNAMKKIKLLALSGSLRKASYNTAMLEALSELSPSNVEISIFRKLGELPLFNPDTESESNSVFESLRSELGRSQGLVIASPEYAHGISGLMKNALDWLVGGEEFVDMPVVILNASPRSNHALNALKEVVTTMSGRIIEEACVSLPLLGSGFNSDDIKENPSMAAMLEKALKVFYEEILKEGE
ncbi:MAG: NAD(P)H-dependent oxidoreductase [Verrucomicrobiales bacterium]|nr:NAD(P)H-dependent oxidoreductase [Verrucomicrobiales bacterium]